MTTRRLWWITAALAAVAAIAAIGVASAHDKAGPHKKLFGSRWYQQASGGDYDAYMTLSTSQLWYDCSSDCESRWPNAANAAIDDWNGQDTTVNFDIQPDHDIYYDVNIFIVDAILGDSGLLGIALPYDINEDFCDLDDCTIYYGEVYLGDLGHTGPYGTKAQRTGTTAHEAGHIISLRHESVNGDESVQYPCGQDNTGPIPHSIMSYNCADPVAVGGLGENYVQEWDVCGVNHAYHDPTIGYAGCGGEPVPTPTFTPTKPPTFTPTKPPTATPTPTKVATDIPTPTSPDLPTPTKPADPTPTPGSDEKAIKGLEGCTKNTLPGNDDDSTELVSLPFSANFFGSEYGGVYVNNNGNVTFDAELEQFTPSELGSVGLPIIAPFFADVDTREEASVDLTYGNATFDGRPALCVNWDGVGYYNRKIDKLNEFQLLLVDRSDVAPGDFDIVFNYDQVEWETGDQSGGTDGLGGDSARAGYANGVDVAFEIEGSGVNGALLDSNAAGLTHQSLGSSTEGRYVFAVRGGVPAVPTSTPTPEPTAANTPTPAKTSTPTNTPTATRTPTNTRTPTPELLTGDVSCDGVVNAIDVAYILQLNAGLLGGLPCAAGDVNGDGVVSTLDAALVLQYIAGFLSTLG
ncbi:MAG: nidogen-like domain-containing protein [Dehalococcoidia bacterium]